MGFSSATRRLKSIRLKKERMPIGNLIDSAGQTHYQEPTDAATARNSVSPPAVPPAGFENVRSLGDTKAALADPNVAYLQQQHPPVLPSLPSDVSGRVAMAGSATQEDIIVYRLNSWKQLVKEFSKYFEAVASAEKTFKKAMDRAMEEFDVPLKSDNCFSGIERMGIQQLAMNLRDVHRMYAAQHALLAQEIDNDTLDRLEALRVDIKDSLKVYVDHLDPIYRRLRKQAKEVEEYKEKLVHAVEAYKKKHRTHDAWLIQQQVRRELTKQADLENALYKAVQAERVRLSRWEQSGNQSNRDAIKHCLQYIEKFDAHSESQSFDMHFGPRATTVLLEGALEREKGLIKKFHPSYVVLTKLGYLHCFSEQSDLLEKNPEMTFHLAECSVVLLDDTRTFQVVISDKVIGRSKYVFRASDPVYVNHWINAIISVTSKPLSPEQHVIGGTLRNAQDAVAASATATTNAPNALPTAAGVTVGELSARHADEDAAAATEDAVATAQASAAVAPVKGETFHPARELVSKVATESPVANAGKSLPANSKTSVPGAPTDAPKSVSIPAPEPATTAAPVAMNTNA
ncbi:hypothetical protein BX661DRAFT_180977 [Kickxella alabastrina]|uniref:uncharacterized protein n=1 Tax=Kickxella alabastrina TaxID=61397 RepID=UPI00221F520E|nr:uncharacterized protein BX661DRAFT_180977 [Kickxella alabastrina]KAI7830037.1 hypothetical protein BX661DRAFT_180977 [Kickxella alabastrina]